MTARKFVSTFHHDPDYYPGRSTVAAERPSDTFALWARRQIDGPGAVVAAVLRRSLFWTPYRTPSGRLRPDPRPADQMTYDDVARHLHERGAADADWVALRDAWWAYWRAGCPSTPTAVAALSGAHSGPLGTMGGDDTGRPAPARESAPPGTDAVG